MKKKVKGRGQGQERTGSPLKKVKVKGAIERVSPGAKPSLRSKSLEGCEIAGRSAGLREQRIDRSVKKVKGRGEGEQRIGPLVKNVKGGRMTPLGGGSLHERAEACRAWARAECEKRNAAAEKAALAAGHFRQRWDFCVLFHKRGQVTLRCCEVGLRGEMTQ